MNRQRHLRPVHAPSTSESRRDHFAERSVIGSVLLEPSVLLDVEPIVTPEDFDSSAHAIIFECFLALAARGEVIDPVTLAGELRAREKLDTIGGTQFIAELTDTIVTTAHAERHARIVAEHAVARRIERAAGEIAARARDASVRLDELCETSMASIFDATARRTTTDPVSVGDGIGEAFERMERTGRGESTDAPIATGFRDVTKVTGGGFRPGELVILGARPRIGKSVIAMQMARAAAEKRGVLVFSFEMPRSQLVDRLLAAEARLPHDNVRQHALSRTQMETLVSAAQTLHQLPLHIDDVPCPIGEIRSRARRFARRHDVGMIVVDYLQYVPASEAQKNQPRWQVVGEIARGLKALARELGVPVLTPTIVNREGTDAPKLEHLRESGDIEATADLVLLLHREDIVDRQSTRRGLADLIVAKQRNGVSGVSIELRYNAPCVRFDDMPREDADASRYSVGGFDMEVPR
jgi:replicative DNA helicase